MFIVHFLGGGLVAKLCSDSCDPMEPARLLCLWDFPGMNTGVGHHFLLQHFLGGRHFSEHIISFKLFNPQLNSMKLGSIITDVLSVRK